MSKTAAKQRVSAKRVLRMGAVTCLALSPKGFYNSEVSFIMNAKGQNPSAFQI